MFREDVSLFFCQLQLVMSFIKRQGWLYNQLSEHPTTACFAKMLTKTILQTVVRTLSSASILSLSFAFEPPLPLSAGAGASFQVYSS